MTAPIKPEHRELAASLIPMVASAWVADPSHTYGLATSELALLNKAAVLLADLEATVESRVRLEQTLNAVAWDEVCKWVNGLDSKAERTAPELRRGLDGIWEYVSLLEPPCPGAKEEVSDG
jgi:hypothetical protein